MDDKKDWWESFCESVKNLSALEQGTAIHQALEDRMRGPFPALPEDLPVFQMDVTFPVWQGSCFPVIAKPEAIVMIHPMVRNYYHIRQIEERTGRVAIAKMGYIELVKP